MSALDNATNIYTGYLFRSIMEMHDESPTAFLCYFGAIDYNCLEYYKTNLEKLSDASAKLKIKTLNIILETGGGVVEAVEKMVEMNRYHFETVNFYIPDKAMSAGTIFSMSGDNIYMDYASSLGPIDPQVLGDDGKWVPALGYLEKYDELIKKSANNTITTVEFARFQNIDLAQLSRYEQAKELSIDLLKKWLVEYKFKDWLIHSSTKKPVTLDDKKERAQQIASQLMDTNLWRSHGRMIGRKTLTEELRLKIEDYGSNLELRLYLNQFIELISEYMVQRGMRTYISSNYEALNDIIEEKNRLKNDNG